VGGEPAEAQARTSHNAVSEERAMSTLSAAACPAPFDLSDEVSQRDAIRPILRAVTAGITMKG
jgi:hypothetical protein